MSSWLIDTALFKSPAPGRPHGLRSWLVGNGADAFLSVVSLVEIEAAIAKIPFSQGQRVEALQAWLSTLVDGFGDRIHPVDTETAQLAGRLLHHCDVGHPRHRRHDALLVATAQIHGHALLTKREAIFGPWTKLVVAAP